MENGPVTPYYSLPLEKVYEVLNAALASEIICVLRYKQHYYMTTSIHQEQLQDLFKEHWLDEEKHLETDCGPHQAAWRRSQPGSQRHQQARLLASSRAVTRSPTSFAKICSPSAS